MPWAMMLAGLQDVAAPAAVVRADTSHGPNLVPSERVLKLWRQAQAVCFDIDCTVAKNDQLDLLADFMGLGEQVAAITNSVRAVGCHWLLVATGGGATWRVLLRGHSRCYTPASSQRQAPSGLCIRQSLL
jgi:hypothetical protein